MNCVNMATQYNGNICLNVKGWRMCTCKTDPQYNNNNIEDNHMVEIVNHETIDMCLPHKHGRYDICVDIFFLIHYLTRFSTCCCWITLILFKTFMQIWKTMYQN